MTHKIHCKWFWRYLLWVIWQQQTAADAHRQLLLADAIACGSSLSCYSVVDGITMMAADAAAAMASLTMETAVAVMPWSGSCYLAAVDAASDYHTTDMKKAPGSARGFLMIPDCYVLCTPAIFKNIRNPLIFLQKMATYSCFWRVPSSKSLLQASLRRFFDLLTLVSHILWL